MFEPLELLSLHVLIRLGLWMSKDLNRWIAVIFAFGSALFPAGCVRAIGTTLGRLKFRDPNLIQSLDPNLIFFAGSIPFTAAEVDIERVTVRSPIAGDVLQSDVRVGQYAKTGQLESADDSWQR